MKERVSILICVKNIDKYIGKCLSSILDQTFTDFEVVIVDDLSRDDTQNIIEKFNDKRIRYIRNTKLLGLSESRNQCLKRAKCEYIFFTDGDCTVSKNWIEEGLRYLGKQDCIGVEGKTYYVSEEYKPTRSDSICENRKGGQFMTCNVAYKRSILESIGGFDSRFTYLEDRDLALRAIKLGKICFNPKMIVYHQKRSLNPAQFVRTGARVRNRVLLYKRFGEKMFFMGRIAFPLNLVAIVFPPLILTSFFRNRYKTWNDFALFPFTYLAMIYERLSLWDMCVRERIFLI